MFVSEAKVAAQLTHGNIAQVFDFGEVRGPVLHRPGARARASRCPRCCARRPRRAWASSPSPWRCTSSASCATGWTTRTATSGEDGQPHGPGPPRCVPGQRPHLVRGRSQGHRLRHRQGHQHGGAEDVAGRGEGQVPVLLPRAGPGPAGPGLAHGRVRRGRGALRGGVRQAPLRGRVRRRAAAHPRGRLHPALAGQPRRQPGAGGHHLPGPGAGAARSATRRPRRSARLWWSCSTGTTRASRRRCCRSWWRTCSPRS